MASKRHGTRAVDTGARRQRLTCAYLKIFIFCDELEDQICVAMCWAGAVLMECSRDRHLPSGPDPLSSQHAHGSVQLSLKMTTRSPRMKKLGSINLATIYMVMKSRRNPGLGSAPAHQPQRSCTFLGTGCGTTPQALFRGIAPTERVFGRTILGGVVISTVSCAIRILVAVCIAICVAVGEPTG
jgi:hypothetical protein